MLMSEKMAYSRYEFFPIHQKMRNWYLGNYKKKKKKEEGGRKIFTRFNLWLKYQNRRREKLLSPSGPPLCT